MGHLAPTMNVRSRIDYALFVAFIRVAHEGCTIDTLDEEYMRNWEVAFDRTPVFRKEYDHLVE